MKKAAYLLIASLLSPALAYAQLDRSALEYMLQRKKISKTFPQKRFGDHLFVEGGAGFTFTAHRGTSSRVALGTPGVISYISIGDWITPEHGWRVGIGGGYYHLTNKAKYAGGSLDYLMNITALARPTYGYRPFEVYGIAGVEGMAVRHEGATRFAYGAHLGLRAQIGLGRFAYLYLEPRAGIYSDKLFGGDTWRKFRPAASLMAGLGYRLHGGRPADATTYRTSGSFLDGTFLSVAGGPSFLANSTPSTWSDYKGARATVSLGKWFDPYNALRVNFETSTHSQYKAKRTKAVGIGADYLLNLHNLFGGYDPTRWFSVNGVAGVNVNVSGCRSERRYTTFGIGGGLQANFSVAKHVDLFLEPRVDFHREQFAQHFYAMKHWDVVPSLMVGMTFKQGTRTLEAKRNSEEFEAENWLDHLFVEASAGARMLTTSHSVGHPRDFACAVARTALGKWFSPTSGLRLWGEAGKLKQSSKTDAATKTLTLGIDYLWNLTNTFNGYQADRRFEMAASLGANLSAPSGRNRVYPGANVGLQGIWNINRTWGLFIEPQLKVYGDKYMQHSSNHFQADFVTSLSAGLRISTGDRASRIGGTFASSEKKEAFVSAAAGVAVPAHQLRNSDMYGPKERVSYGKWINSASAWRANLSHATHKGKDNRYTRTALGADYIVDVSDLSYGYNPDRLISTRTYAGVDLVLDHTKRQGTVFTPEVHAGIDLAVRVSPDFEVYLEPQLGFQFKGIYPSRLDKLTPSLMLGVNYTLPFSKKNKE